LDVTICSDARDGLATYMGDGLDPGFIYTQDDCGGWPELNSTAAPTDTDGDGMPDSWETAHGLNPNVADNNSLNDDGYTALEVYINSLMGEIMDENFTSGIRTATMENVSTPNARYNIAGQRVGANFKGIIIQNGKKYLKK